MIKLINRLLNKLLLNKNWKKSICLHKFSFLGYKYLTVHNYSFEIIYFKNIIWERISFVILDLKNWWNFIFPHNILKCVFTIFLMINSYVYWNYIFLFNLNNSLIFTVRFFGFLARKRSSLQPRTAFVDYKPTELSDKLTDRDQVCFILILWLIV